MDNIPMDNQESLSILTDIKKSLSGIPEEDEAFDQDILLNINSSLAVLNQLGIGPEAGMIVSDKSTLWSEFEEDPVVLGMARQFVLVSVKIGFDPPSSSFVLESLKELRKELSFRLTIEHDRLRGET